MAPNRFFSIILLIICCLTSKAQVLTSEDSLHAGLLQKDNSTVVSGYGEMKVTYDNRLETANANITRMVLFLGHRFNSSISLFSEIELEDAHLSGGEPGGELSLEQLFIRFNINRDHYLAGGLFLPRIGIMNENHLPTTFFSNDRPFVEQLVIPATWREMGIGIYGEITAVPGLQYSAAVTNGLHSSGFTNGTGIRNGRFGGSNATATNIALSGSLLYYTGNFRIQASGYYGGSAGLSQRDADSLMLDNGPFGTPVGLAEMNVQYSNGLFSFSALAAYLTIPDAFNINRAYANNTPESIYGVYADAGIDILELIRPSSEKSLDIFARYETMDLNKSIPANGIKDDINERDFIVAGVRYIPAKGVAIKADYVHRVTGEPNPALVINPFPQAPPYYKQNGFINIGIGYSF